MSGLRKFTLLFLFVFMVTFFPSAGAQPQSPDSLDEQLHSLEERMKRLEEGQKEMAERQKEILAAIDNLRVWIRSS